MLGFHSISEYPISDKAVPNLAGQLMYSWGGANTVPTNEADMPNGFTATDYANVATQNSTFEQSNNQGLTYTILMLKQVGANSTSSISLTWNGKSARAASTATITLQIYNYNTGLWETLASNSTAAANTVLTLTGSKSTSQANYYAPGNLVTARVYQ